MKNAGNSCYIGSTLQLLACLPDFTRIRPTRNKSRFVPSDAIMELVAAVRRTDASAVDLKHHMRAMCQMKTAIGLACSTLKITGTSSRPGFETKQEDPSEALGPIIEFVCFNARKADRYLADRLMCRVVTTREICGVVGLAPSLSGPYVAARSCGCGSAAPVPDSSSDPSVFLHVFLPVGDIGTERSLADLLAIENARIHHYECANKECKMGVGGSRLIWEVQESISLASDVNEVLVLISRFSHPGNNALGVRNDGLVQPSMVMTLPVATASGASEDVQFELKAAILQEGTLDAGHVAMMAEKSGRWGLYNDSKKADLGPAGSTAEQGQRVFDNLGAEMRTMFFPRNCYILLLRRLGWKAPPDPPPLAEKDDPITEDEKEKAGAGEGGTDSSSARSDGRSSVAGGGASGAATAQAARR